MARLSDDKSWNCRRPSKLVRDGLVYQMGLGWMKRSRILLRMRPVLKFHRAIPAIEKRTS